MLLQTAFNYAVLQMIVIEIKRKDPSLTPIRHQPHMPPLPVSDDDTDQPSDSLSAHDDTDTDSTT
jgi:hypothetical protein